MNFTGQVGLLSETDSRSSREGRGETGREGLRKEAGKDLEGRAGNDWSVKTVNDWRVRDYGLDISVISTGYPILSSRPEVQSTVVERSFE